MADIYLVLQNPLPAKMVGSYSRISLGPLSHTALLSIEDRFFKDGDKWQIPKTSSVIVLPDVSADQKAMHEAALLAEFAMSLITASGHPSIILMAAFSGGACTKAVFLPPRELPAPAFVDTITGPTAAQWLGRCVLAQKHLTDRLHITTRRYVRFARSEGDADGLLDLCISLESLLDNQTEVSFRFGVSLVKITGEKGSLACEMGSLLSGLYDIRSKLAHGDPKAATLIQKLQPQSEFLRRLAKRILTIYILYTSEHSRKEWKQHVQESLYA